MHETAIAEALMEQVRPLVPAGAALRSVQIDVGELEHLDADVMRTVWSALTAGTPFDGSTLGTTRVPVRVRCRACGHEHDPRDVAILQCPACRAVQPEVLEGSGVLLRSLDVDGISNADGA
jgi:hydrogenase nickel incorporation protein HypA/HybF